MKPDFVEFYIDENIPSDASEFVVSGTHGEDSFGPDEVFVLLEGPEVIVLPQSHAGDCVYEFPFRCVTILVL